MPGQRQSVPIEKPAVAQRRGEVAEVPGAERRVEQPCGGGQLGSELLSFAVVLACGEGGIQAGMRVLGPVDRQVALRRLLEDGSRPGRVAAFGREQVRRDPQGAGAVPVEQLGRTAVQLPACRRGQAPQHRRARDRMPQACPVDEPGRLQCATALVNGGTLLAEQPGQQAAVRFRLVEYGERLRERKGRWPAAIQTAQYGVRVGIRDDGLTRGAQQRRDGMSLVLHECAQQQGVAAADAVAALRHGHGGLWAEALGQHGGHSGE